MGVWVVPMGIWVVPNYKVPSSLGIPNTIPTNEGYCSPMSCKEFEGALPTTIYQAGFSEVYGQSPDIDSTALMLSTTSGFPCFEVLSLFVLIFLFLGRLCTNSPHSTRYGPLNIQP
jgi:hypothetical protein